jgi:TetR/AcrR family transcriptional repressor of mexJK operon
MRARKTDEVLDAARHVFLRRGFESATVEEVAAEAGVSKATVYSNFYDKDALLVAMIDRVTRESEAILVAAVAPLDETGLLHERFSRMGEALVRGVLRPEVVQLRRLAISTAIGFPASALLYWQRGPAATIAMLEQRLGALGIEDARARAILFAYALIGPLQDRALFDPDYTPSTADIEAHVASAVALLN